MFLEKFKTKPKIPKNFIIKKLINNKEFKLKVSFECLYEIIYTKVTVFTKSYKNITEF